jgi:outer membrane receptor protein involved in Fe transport
MNNLCSLSHKSPAHRIAIAPLLPNILPHILPGTALLIWILLSLATPLAAQITTSSIEGTVSDSQGLRIPGADITVASPALATTQHIQSDANGNYRAVALPAGEYTLTVSHSGFTTKTFEHLIVYVNQPATFDITLGVGAVSQQVTVTGESLLIETKASSTGGTITPQEIEDMPLNGRNYLDLMQLISGVNIQRQADPTTDAATPILGERGGNAVFLIDGMPNSNEVNGGAAAQFNQDSIMEFQVITSGYKAEFGHGSGGIINVVSKSGTNDWHGGASFFHRNYELDSSDNSLKTPFLLRWDPTIYLGGPVKKNSIFFFGSLERIRESRSLNFVFPNNIPPALVAFETPFDRNSETFETRGRIKFDETWGRHRFSEQLNMTNNHVTDYLPLELAVNLPDTRNNDNSSATMVGLSDLVTLGDQSNPYILNGYFQYRREPFLETPSHPQAGEASTLFNLFSSYDTGGLFGDQGQVQFGPGHTPLLIKQYYDNWGLSFDHITGHHDWKFGWDAEHMRVDGNEANNFFNQLFATVSDFQEFGPVASGVYFLTVQDGAVPADNNIDIHNLYDGLFLQDDWKLRKNLTLNLGVRWDYDSGFPNAGNVSPRIGGAWAITPNTVVNASWGIFYDHFRLGLARDIPAFGGADITGNTFLSFPRLFYGDPSFVSIAVGGPCLSSTMTDAQIAAAGETCPFVPGDPYYGINHLNDVVAAGHAPIPANAVINEGNVQSLTGFTPTQFANAASAAIGEPAGYFSYDSFGSLTTDLVRGTTLKFPIQVDPQFRTPYTLGFHAGVQHQFSANTAIAIDYYHKNIDHILGVRATNLAFAARLNGHTGETTDGKPITETYGPWYSGNYDGVTADFHKRMNRHFSLEFSYTYSDETDNQLNTSFISDTQAAGSGVQFTALNGPTDSFIGVPPVVTDPVTGQTNAHGSFIISAGAAKGNPVPQAGKFYYGPNLDKGPSDLSVPHMFFTDGIWQLPWHFELTGIFRVQSGFLYSATQDMNFTDVDGDNISNGFDWELGRNRFEAPIFANLDMRIAKTFVIHERFRTQILLEYFNILNRNNPAAVEQLPTEVGSDRPAFGTDLQVLPGREGQVGVRFDF